MKRATFLVVLGVLSIGGCGRRYVVGANSAGGSSGGGGAGHAGGAGTTGAAGGIAGAGGAAPGIAGGGGAGGIAGGGGTGTTAAKLSFLAARPYKAGPNLSAIAFADFNRDGKNDLVASSSLATDPPMEGVNVLLGLGDGTFSSPIATPTGGLHGKSVVLADVNRDGKTDLVLPGVGAVAVLLGNGDGSFTSAPVLASGTGQTAVAVADLDGDAKPDLVVANTQGSGGLSVRLGNGDGSFGAATAVAGGAAAPQIDLGLGDLDGDGKADLVVFTTTTPATGPADVSVRLGAGNGTFGAAVHTAAGTNSITSRLVLADADGDGKLDVIAASGKLSVLLNQGGGTLAAPVDYAVNAQALVARDLNGDGKLDLAGQGLDGTVSVLFGNGDGSFAAARELPPTGSGGTQSQALAVADLDGDGRVDLASTDSGQAYVFLGNGDGSFVAAPTYLGTGGPVVLGDVNGDGKPDFVSAGSSIAANLGDGHGAFGAPLGPTAVATGPLAIAAADLTGDGKLDLAVAFADNGGEVHVLAGNGDGSFTMTASYPAGGPPRAVTLGDLDGDGRPDLALADDSGNVDVRLAGAGGVLGALARYGVGMIPDAIAIGDLDGDGKPDLVVANDNTGDMSVLLNTGAGAFAAQVKYAVGPYTAGSTIADLNGDGVPDLAFSDSEGAGVLLGLGGGTFAAAIQYQGGASPVTLAIADLDGDGKLDIVLADVGSSDVAVLRGNGDGTFGAAVRYATAFSPRSVAAVDLNGDGRPDLAVGVSLGVTVLLNTSH
jgi:hypothetical protein